MSLPASTRFGVLATALFYGDAMITPAVSVLSAVEGITVAAPGFSGWILPLAVAIIVMLFSIQRGGSARVGMFFGPVMLVYFVVIATLFGINLLVPDPIILVDEVLLGLATVMLAKRKRAPKPGNATGRAPIDGDVRRS